MNNSDYFTINERHYATEAMVISKELTATPTDTSKAYLIGYNRGYLLGAAQAILDKG